MYIVCNNCGTDTIFYLSLSHEANKHGFPVFVQRIEQASKFKTKKEAKSHCGKSDYIQKLL